MSVRAPETISPARIEPLAVLPVFFRLAGGRIVLAGARDGALWKAELLAAAGANLHVFAEAFSPAMLALAARPPAGCVTLHARVWRPEDFAGAILAVGDIDGEDEARRFAEAARAAGAAVNIVDKPEFCAFQFGSIVNRSPLVIGISTDGAAPVFGQAIRTRIEAVIPHWFAAWARAACAWRPLVQKRKLGFAARRRFWQLFTERAFAQAGRAPDEADRFALFAGLDAAPERYGRVTLVGAGPGDPELLTLKAVRALQSADIILHDELVSHAVLDLARREAKRQLVGKKGHGPSCKQDDINRLMVALAREGHHVVRLKSGDPGIFGRASEELAACRAAGIPVSIVPGITAAQGAAASLGLSLTERNVARRLQFLTGHARDGKLPADISWAAIADPGATTILYMPRRTLAHFAAGALAAGLAPETPAIAVMNATRPNETRLAATIAGLPERLPALPDEGPVLILIGWALAEAVEPAKALPAMAGAAE